MAKLRTPALLLSMLVISLPLVHAQILNVIAFGGSDGAKGYARPGENIQGKIQVSIPGETIIDDQQVKIFTPTSFFLPDQCTDKGNQLFECTFTKALPFGTYDIALFDDDNKLDSQATPLLKQTITLSTDSIPPKVFLSFNPQASRDGRTTLDVRVEDYATSTGDTTSCSGLQTVTIKAGTTVLAQQHGQQGDCVFTTTLPYQGPTDGLHTTTICGQATDFVGRTSTETCRTFVTDNKPPTIGSLTIRGTFGLLTKLKSGQPQTVTLDVLITGDNDDVVAVTADLFALGGSTTPPDGKNGNHYVWNTDITPGNDCSIIVEATDSFGNKAHKTLNCQLPLDDVPPTLISVDATAKDGDTLIIGKNAEFTITFKDEDNTGGPGVGMAGAQAFVDTGSLGKGTAKVEKCEKQGENWACILRFKNLKDTTTRITIQAADDLGNAVQGITRQVRAVVTGPSITEVSPITVVEGQTDTGGIATQGKTIRITGKATNFVTAFANMTSIGAGNVMGTCQADTCEFLGVITNTGPYVANIPVVFVDNVGNEAQVVRSINVAGTTDNNNPNYYSNSITCTPRLIDRHTASLISQKQYCVLNLQQNNPAQNAQPVTITLDRAACTGTFEGALADLQLINNVRGSFAPVLVATLDARDFEVNTINIDCPIKITSTTGQGNTFTLVNGVEEERANITIQFYNQPFGTLYKEQQKKIDEKLKDAKDTLKWVGVLKKLVKIAEAICKLYNLVVDTIKTLKDAAAILLHTGEKTSLLGSGTAITAAGQAVCGTEEITRQGLEPVEGSGGYRNMMRKFCSFVNCQYTEKPDENAGIISKGAAALGGGSGGLFQICTNTNAYLAANTGELGTFALGANGRTISQGQNNIGTSITSNKMPKSAQKNIEKIEKERHIDASSIPLNIINVKDSLIWSSLCLCLPGVINGLERLRQVKCQSALCYKKDVKENGFPLSYCSEVEEYLMCSYVYGEIWNFIPFSALFDRIMSAITDVLSLNPGAIASLGLGILCACSTTAEIYTVCSTTQILSELSESSFQLLQMFKTKNFFQTALGLDKQTDYCEQLKEEGTEENNA